MKIRPPCKIPTSVGLLQLDSSAKSFRPSFNVPVIGLWETEINFTIQ